MSVIIRLQNLPWNANAIDIRHFFQGQSIPDGGVHIVGGDKGDAFIAFSTDEDARLAMQKDGGRIHSSQVKLLLSSKTEMQNVIAAAKGAGPPPVQQVSSGVVKEPAFYERPAVPPAGLYGSQKAPDPPFQSGFQGGDVYRDRPRDYPGVPIGAPARLAEERFPSRGPGEVSAGAPLHGGLALGPSSHQPPLVDGRQVPGGMSRPSHSGDMGGYHQPPPLDPRQIPGAMSRPSHGGDMSGSVRSQFGEVGPGIQEASVNVRGQPARLPDLRRQNEQAVEERRHFGDFDSTKFVDERGPPFPGERNLGPGGRDFNRSNVEMASDPRDFGLPHNGRNVGRPNFPDDTGRPGMIRYDAERPLQEERNFDRPDNMRSINRHGRDVFEGSDYPRNAMPPDYVRYDEQMRDLGRSRSGALDDRGPRQGGNDNFNGRPGANLAPGVGRGMMGPHEGFEVNRQPLIPDVPGSRFSHETRLPNRDPGMGSTHIPDIREVDNVNRTFESQYSRQRDRFQEDIPPPKRLRPEDPRNAIRPEAHREPFNGFPRERPPADRELDHARHENWPAEGRDMPNVRRQEQNEDPREQLTFRCTNFPRIFNYKEVRRFFSGCEIPREGLKLLNDRSGSRSGTAYVMFLNNRSAMTALGMNGKMAMDCKVRIERCPFKEYDSVVDSQTGPPPRHRSRSPPGRRNAPDGVPGVFYFVVKKLPPKADRADVKRFFGKFRIAADGGPFMELAPTGNGCNPTGNALLAIEKLRNPGEVIKALHRSPLQGSNVDVIAVGKIEYDERTKRSRQSEDPKSKEKKDAKQEATPKDAPSSNKSSAPDVEKKSFCIHIKGVPFSADAAMVKDFFRGLDIAPNGIRLVVNGEGRATGDAYVEFTNSFDQKKAMEMDKKYMGHRYVELRTLSRQAMVSEHHSKQKQCGGPPVEVDGPNRNPPVDVDDNNLCAMRNLHPNTQLEDILDFFRGYRPIVDSIKLQYKDGQPTGDGLVAFSTPQEAESAVRSKNQHYLLGRLITLNIWSNKK